MKIDIENVKELVCYDPESVQKICAEMRYFSRGNPPMFAFSERIRIAHEREIAELKELLNKERNRLRIILRPTRYYTTERNGVNND